MNDDEVLQRLTTVRTWQRDGQRAPHKPLLILMAIAALEKGPTSEVDWQSEVQPQLGALLTEYGPTGASHPEMPFTRLRSDGIWQLSRADISNDSKRDLAAAPVSGRFTSEVEASLRASATLRQRVAREIVDAQFPDTLKRDVLVAVGLDPDRVMATASATEHQLSKRRDRRWRDRIVEAWDRQCAFCGFDGQLSYSTVGIEAAHVRWFNLDGPDDDDNGLALCALHHRLLDSGVLGLRDPQTVVVSQAFSARTPAGRAVYDLHGHELRPRRGTALPHVAHVEWHTQQVFKRPALSA